jgi:hypothetical protein
MSVLSDDSHFTDCSTLIIYHPGLVQHASWPAYQVDTVSPQPNKLKKLSEKGGVGNFIIWNKLSFSKEWKLILAEIKYRWDLFYSCKILELYTNCSSKNLYYIIFFSFILRGVRNIDLWRYTVSFLLASRGNHHLQHFKMKLLTERANFLN